MNNKKLIRIFLPLADDSGMQFPSVLFTTVKKMLTDRFGGLTVHARSPAIGLWKESPNNIQKDNMVIFEVIANGLEEQFWTSYKHLLQKQFQQDEVLITCSDLITV